MRQGFAPSMFFEDVWFLLRVQRDSHLRVEGLGFMQKGDEGKSPLFKEPSGVGFN